jgi:hypothetical protein
MPRRGPSARRRQRPTQTRAKRRDRAMNAPSHDPTIWIRPDRDLVVSDSQPASGSAAPVVEMIGHPQSAQRAHRRCELMRAGAALTVLLVLLWAAAGARASAPFTRGILLRGVVVTMDRDYRVLHDGNVLVRESRFSTDPNARTLAARLRLTPLRIDVLFDLARRCLTGSPRGCRPADLQYPRHLRRVRSRPAADAHPRRDGDRPRQRQAQRQTAQAQRPPTHPRPQACSGRRPHDRRARRAVRGQPRHHLPRIARAKAPYTVR